MSMEFSDQIFGFLSEREHPTMVKEKKSLGRASLMAEVTKTYHGNSHWEFQPLEDPLKLCLAPLNIKVLLP